MLRRDFIKLAAAALTCPSSASVVCAQTDEFDKLLDAALSDENLLSAGREFRERQIFEFDNFITKGIAPRHGKSSRPISERAMKLIIGFEVTDQRTYEAKYQGAIWPKGKSGVTVGIGYDVGYVTKDLLHEDWDQLIDAGQVTALEIGCKIHGPPASKLLPKLGNIRIPWSIAYQQFRERVLPLYVAETVSALPNAGKLSDDCLGALVSLVYNRGASFRNVGDRYEEMRAVRLHMVQEEFSRIPAELRSMRRIWRDDPDMKGLITRRELEARLFEVGMRG